jgi:malate synthase
VIRDKLVFCSSPDMGNISPYQLATYHPVGSEVEGIFRIGAAMADNSRWKPSGGKRIVDYILPGHGVREAKGCEVFPGTNEPLKPGSWIATPLAAGLAALLIHIVRMAAIHTYLQGKERSQEANLTTLESLETIKSFDAMRRTFDMMANKASGKSYVHVWGYFNQTCLDLEAADTAPDGEAEKWRIILELARDLVPRRTWRRPLRF